MSPYRSRSDDASTLIGGCLALAFILAMALYSACQPKCLASHPETCVKYATSYGHSSDGKSFTISTPYESTCDVCDFREGQSQGKITAPTRATK